MYNCLIADDNLVERDALEMHLSKINQLRIVATCSSGSEAAQVLLQEKVDIVFSDIDMPDLSGIGLIKSLSNPPVFIFVSSYTEFAAESYSLDVIDYVVKPALFDRVLKSVEKAIEYIEIKKQTKATSTITIPEPAGFHEIGSRTASDEYFFIKDQNGFTKLLVADVMFIESMGDFSRIHTVQHKSFVVLVSLKNIEKQVSPNVFRRVHKQYIVNLSHIHSVMSAELQLSDKQHIPVSQLYKQNLLESVVERKLLKRFSE